MIIKFLEDECYFYSMKQEHKIKVDSKRIGWKSISLLKVEINTNTKII